MKTSLIAILSLGCLSCFGQINNGGGVGSVQVYPINTNGSTSANVIAGSGISAATNGSVVTISTNGVTPAANITGTLPTNVFSVKAGTSVTMVTNGSVVTISSSGGGGSGSQTPLTNNVDSDGFSLLAIGGLASPPASLGTNAAGAASFQASYYEVNATLSPVTITLPSAGTLAGQNANGMTFVFSSIGTNTNGVILTLSGGDTWVQGGSSVTNTGRYETIMVQSGSSGSLWKVLSMPPQRGDMVSSMVAKDSSRWQRLDGTGGFPDYRNLFPVAANTITGGVPTTTIGGGNLATGGSINAGASLTASLQGGSDIDQQTLGGFYSSSGATISGNVLMPFFAINMWVHK